MRAQRIVAFLLSATGVALAAQPAVAQPVRPAFYAHVGGALGATLLNFGDMSTLADGYGVGISGARALVARVGFQQVVQGEFRRGKEDHVLRLTGFVQGGDIGVLDERPMEYEVTQWTVKVNPKFRGESNFPYYLVVGRSQVDYLNEAAEGFEGTGTILGVEFIAVNQFLSVTTGLKRHGISFTPTSPEFFGTTLAPSASYGAANWVLDFSVAAGLGII